MTHEQWCFEQRCDGESAYCNDDDCGKCKWAFKAGSKSVDGYAIAKKLYREYEEGCSVVCGEFFDDWLDRMQREAAND